MVDRLTTPLQFIHYAWRALEEAYITGQKPVDAETVHKVLVPDLDGLEPRLMRLDYPVKSLCKALNARPAEIRAFLRGRLAQGRVQRFKSPGHAQRFLAAYGPIASHFRL